MSVSVNASKSVAVNVSDLERRTLSKVKRYLYFYLMVGTIFFQIDKFNIGFAQLTMGNELGLKAAAFGFAAGILYVSSLLMQVPADLLFDTFAKGEISSGAVEGLNNKTRW